MIISFSVSNFRTFSSQQSLTFRATADRSHQSTQCVATGLAAFPRLTRMAVLFGPNSSGKSTLLTAFRTMREIVLDSSSYSTVALAALYTPFRSARFSVRPTSFGVELLINRVRYRYCFSYDAGRIVSEELRIYRSQKPQRWVDRSFDPATSQETWRPFFSGTREGWHKATKAQSLYVTVAAGLGAEAFKPLMHWFTHQVDIVLDLNAIDTATFATRLSDMNFKTKILKIFHSVDIPISDVRRSGANAAPHMPAARNLTAPSIEFLYAHRGAVPVWLDLKQMSAGPQRLVSLLTPLIDGMENDRLVAIDEFDNSLHPLITQYLVRLINDPAAVHRRVQVLLICNTLTLMDVKLLRRDEIWLTGLDASGGTRLTALTTHRPRRQETIARSYLRGNYGALPAIE